jgi:hypothetical protein
MKTILLVILVMGKNCILEAPEPEPAEVIFLGITILFFKKHFSENFKNFKKKEYLPNLLESTLFLELNSNLKFKKKEYLPNLLESILFLELNSMLATSNLHRIGIWF